MLTDEPAVARLARWVEDRLDRPILCADGVHGELSEPRCEVVVTRQASTAAGHPGYCSPAHDALAQDDQVM